MIYSLKNVVNILMITLQFLFIFSVMGIQLFMVSFDGFYLLFHILFVLLLLLTFLKKKQKNRLCALFAQNSRYVTTEIIRSSLFSIDLVLTAYALVIAQFRLLYGQEPLGE